MKRVVIIILMSISAAFLFAQETEVIEVESNKLIAVSTYDAWSIVQDWGNLNNLVPEVVKSTRVYGGGINSTWDIELVNGGLISEKMVYYDPSRMTMSYIMTKTPMPIKDYRAILKIEPYGIAKSLVSFYTSCETQSDDSERIMNTFRNFQETYLSNIEKQKK